MNKLRYLSLFASALFGVCAGHATTVIPPTFDQLVSRAQVIFQGTVTDVRSQWAGEGGQRHIVTFVTFKVEDTLKGNAGATYSIRLLGGTVDGETMEVTDTPKFKVGDRDILFVENNGSQFVPLVGIMNGRFRIQRDQQAGHDIVTTGGGQPLSSVAQLGTGRHAASGVALSPEEFKSAIRTKLAQPTR
ncbi:MAG TPA: hypothetical protein DCO65_07305 [Spartobacteria bacterium]|jgi:hypothetical protein|nr:hypothetical protein [Spartobacteria bacterium]